jgi:hypothetical protein
MSTVAPLSLMGTRTMGQSVRSQNGKFFSGGLSRS